MSKNKTTYGIRILLSCVLLLIGIFSYAQQQTITGTVTSAEDGLGKTGVIVLEKGTSNGTATDANGNYTITVSDNNSILVFSYIGYTTKEVAVGSQTELDVSIEENTNELDEVVVIGYGSVNKSDITGSVSSVNSEELTAFPVLDAQQALQGRAAGVSVQSNNGAEPGAPITLRVRGNTSISASSAALIVVDGFVGGTLPQPNDIESIEILKDASATAIYGSRGSGGVVLVTTKKGKKGKPVIELNTSFGSQTVREQIDLLNASQFATYYQAISPSYTQGPANTDWQDLIYRNGNVASHQLSISGGSDAVNYYVSGNYFDQKGVVINSGFERFSFLSNLDIQASDRLKLGFNAFANRSNKNGIASQANSGGRGGGDVISIAYRFAPDLPVQNSNGVNTQNSVGDDVDNPVGIALEAVDETKNDDYRANFYADYRLAEGLSFKSTFGFSTENDNRGRFLPSTLVAQAGAQGGIANVQNRKEKDLLSENYLTYQKELGKGNFTSVLGYSYQKIQREQFGAAAQGFISNSVSYYSLGSASTLLPSASSLTETEIISQFGRLNYDYDDKYLLTFTARRDGSSNFARNNKYSFFPSGAIGWKMSNEDFLLDNPSISNLKLRASYGVTGNPSIAPYQSLASFDDIYAVVGGSTVSAVVPEQLANPDLKWESSYQSNFGLDLGLWNDRVTASLDIYNIDTEDVILGDSSAPEYIGFANPTALKNIGEINNKGVELTLTSKNVSKPEFSWTTDLNWSRNRNEVVKLLDGQDIFLDSSPGSFLQDETHVLREGEPVGVFYGYEFRGVNQTGTAPAGTAGFTNDAGDELFTDVNGDGAITSADRMIIGDPNQDWIGGLNNTLQYKGFDFNVFFQSAVGGDIFSYTFLEIGSGGSNASTEALDAWTPTNTNTNVPAPKVREKRITSRYVYDGSYIRMKNLALGYTLPSDLSNRIKIPVIRLGVSGQNLLTFTDFPGTDPEARYRSQGSQNSNVNQGFDYGSYPNVKTLLFSANLKF